MLTPLADEGHERVTRRAGAFELVLLMMLIVVALKTRGLRRSAYPGSAR